MREEKRTIFSLWHVQTLLSSVCKRVSRIIWAYVIASTLKSFVLCISNGRREQQKTAHNVQIKWQQSHRSAHNFFFGTCKEKGNAALLSSTVFKCFPAKLILVFPFLFEVALHSFLVWARLFSTGALHIAILVLSVCLPSYSWEFTQVLVKLLSIYLVFEFKSLRRHSYLICIYVYFSYTTNETIHVLNRESGRARGSERK